MARAITTNWDGVPHTHKKATVVEHRTPTKAVHAVEIANGMFRGSPISGVFELAEATTDLRITKTGKQTIEVKLGWFGAKPLTCWANVTVIGRYKIHSNYTGLLVHNIQSDRGRS